MNLSFLLSTYSSILQLFLFSLLFSAECKKGFYGYTCKETCSMTCGNPGICDRITGHCSGGCRAGWTGLLCDEGNILVIYICLYVCAFIYYQCLDVLFKKNIYTYIFKNDF